MALWTCVHCRWSAEGEEWVMLAHLMQGCKRAWPFAQVQYPASHLQAVAWLARN